MKLSGAQTLELLRRNPRMITTHYYNSRGEVQADKDHLLEELDLTEEEAEIYDTCTPLDYSDQCRVEEIRGLNYLLEKSKHD